MTKGFQTLLSISTCGATTCPTDDCSGATKFFMESLNSKNQTSTPMMANATYEVCGDSVKLGLCEKRLLKGGLLYDWDMSDEAGACTRRCRV